MILMEVSTRLITHVYSTPKREKLFPSIQVSHWKKKRLWSVWSDQSQVINMQLARIHTRLCHVLMLKGQCLSCCLWNHLVEMKHFLSLEPSFCRPGPWAQGGYCEVTLQKLTPALRCPNHGTDPRWWWFLVARSSTEVRLNQWPRSKQGRELRTDLG